MFSLAEHRSDSSSAANRTRLPRTLASKAGCTPPCEGSFSQLSSEDPSRLPPRALFFFKCRHNIPPHSIQNCANLWIFLPATVNCDQSCPPLQLQNGANMYSFSTHGCKTIFGRLAPPIERTQVWLASASWKKCMYCPFIWLQYLMSGQQDYYFRPRSKQIEDTRAPKIMNSRLIHKNLS